MGLPTIETITNLYLYGQSTKPTDLVSDELIRPKLLDNGDKFITSYPVNINEYMRGPGRFATLDRFNIVQGFFEGTGTPYSSDMIPEGVYTKQQVAAYMGLSYYGLSITQSSYGINDPDHLERSYIWESTAFKLSDTTRFVIGYDGTRYMINYGVVPDFGNDPNRQYESFDFESNNPLSIFANTYLVPNIDPSTIGREVRITFNGEPTINTTTAFTYQNYLTAVQSSPESHPIDGINALNNQKEALINQLWDAGTIKFLDGNKPIFYGTDGADDLSVYSLANATNSLITSSKLYELRTNGITLLGGKGNDVLSGGEKNDHLLGGSDDDTLNGGGGAVSFGADGNDILEGGTGTDTYVFNGNYGTDTILDSDGLGSLKINGNTINGGKQVADNRVFQSSDHSHTYTFLSGNAQDGGDLLVDGHIIIKDYKVNSTGNLNLNLTAPDAQGPIIPQTTRDILGDLAPIDFDTSAPGIQMDYDDIGNIKTDGAEPNRNDTLNDSTGNDHIMSLGGDDTINASNGGDDFIEAGSGQDYVYSGAGQDLIMGGAGSDVLLWAAEDDNAMANNEFINLASNNNIWRLMA